MPDAPVRLLLVTDQFSQGGAERYLFELCGALNRRRFDVNILTRQGVDRTQHYYSRITELGIPIHTRRPHVPELRSIAPRLALSSGYRNLHHRVSSALSRKRIGRFLDSFQLVACVQVENYLNLQHAFRPNQAVLIHAMSNQFQYSYDPYDMLPRERRHRFVTWNPTQAREIQAALPNAETFHWPLSMNFRGFADLGGRREREGPARIGIFTRLSREKPLAPLFESFAQVLAHVDATLHVYGGGNPELFTDQVTSLGISDRVFFKGHRPNMIETARSDKLTMCWLMSLGSLLGYASLELAACGMPMLFWNYGSEDTNSIRDETDGAVMAFNSIQTFAAAASECLTDPAQLAEAGSRLREFVRDRHDITRNIAALEDHFSNVVHDAVHVA